METFAALLDLCAGNSPVTGEFPAQRPVTRSFDVFFDLRLNKQLSKQWWGWWFETPSRPLWRHCNVWPKSYKPNCWYQCKLWRHFYYSDATWPPRHLTSPAPRPCVQQLVQPNNKEKNKTFPCQDVFMSYSVSFTVLSTKFTQHDDIYIAIINTCLDIIPANNWWGLFY